MSSVRRRRAENTRASRTVVPAECTSFCSTSARQGATRPGAAGGLGIAPGRECSSGLCGEMLSIHCTRLRCAAAEGQPL